MPYERSNIDGPCLAVTFSRLETFNCEIVILLIHPFLNETTAKEMTPTDAGLVLDEMLKALGEFERRKCLKMEPIRESFEKQVG